MYSEHIAEWVTGHNDLNIKITAQAALPAVHEFHNELEPTSLEGEHQEYTKGGLYTPPHVYMEST